MLPRLEGYAAARLGSLDAAALATVVSELASLEQTVLGQADLRAVLTDTSISSASRGLIVHDLLEGKVHDVTLRVATYAASNAPAQEVPHALAELAYASRELAQLGTFPLAGLGLMAARQRVSGFADAMLDDIDTQNFDEIEDELFRWARTVEGNLELRRLLLDRDAELDSRLGTVQALLGEKVDKVTLALARFVIEGGRARDVVGTLDFLVDYVARARDWRVARVHTARPLDEQSQADLVASLSTLTGKNVELQIADSPELLGGILVEIGDLQLDATTRARLGALRDAVSPGHLYESSLNRND
ncbi:MAG TPA: F0F1 ATP synthase subunit delta [Acidimicrobiales bacterium]|nr:F0F1 ATP synthase subunit delta [Acidimicrobiales bacterium]